MTPFGRAGLLTSQMNAQSRPASAFSNRKSPCGVLRPALSCPRAKSSPYLPRPARGRAPVRRGSCLCRLLRCRCEPVELRERRAAVDKPGGLFDAVRQCQAVQTEVQRDTCVQQDFLALCALLTACKDVAGDLAFALGEPPRSSSTVQSDRPYSVGSSSYVSSPSRISQTLFPADEAGLVHARRRPPCRALRRGWTAPAPSA